MSAFPEDPYLARPQVQDQWMTSRNLNVTQEHFYAKLFKREMITTKNNYRSIPAFHSRLTRINHDSRESSILKMSTDNSDIISWLRQPSWPVQGVKDIKIYFIKLYEPREPASKQTFKWYTPHHLIIHSV